jgi:hypothetical protein
MSDPYVHPAQKLAELLETLPSADRLEITGWLLQRQEASGTLSLSHTMPPLRRRGGTVFEREIATTLPVGEESQLVTIRLPAQRHAELRAWCAEHDFTMAAVVRGLVERFLEQQTPRPAE